MKLRVPFHAALLTLVLAWGGATRAELGHLAPEIDRQLDQIKREAGRDLAAQADALARTAWNEDSPSQPRLAAAARQQLVEFAADGLGALRRALRSAPARYQGDVVVAFIEANDRIRSAVAPELLPGLEEAIWFGSVEAKRLAIPYMTRYRFSPALLTMIDAALEHEELLPDVVQALGVIGNDKARHFLVGVLRTGTAEQRQLAATSLARIGDRALRTLREEVLSDDPLTRRAAVTALVPISVVDDLSLLYDFLGKHGDEQSELLEQIRARSVQLETLRERLLDEQAASY